ncbi:enoyl-CoA hydratase/isomerase family protein [Actinocatenispora rupis]|uniref:Enoyl-CoA hydratase n=1 Tax=Actinocatenispora rupis TaxID=519421 RepID=A0A8J3NCH5_9ACTN|nr:enoyl-CoA hydratase-related protein [Actinocatenispora rupis]GID11782.1 enoyl-CoA hydratase [Actinocatenispora rupis]
MTDAPLLVERADTGVTTLTFHRPESLNSLSVALKEAFRDALAELAADPACRAIVLAGAGRGFCVGQDLREHVETLTSGGEAMRTVHEHYTPIATLLGAMPKPVVAAVRGPAAGAGAAIAFLSDFRIGGPGTSFSMSFADVGLAGDTGVSWTLPRLVGLAKATELTLLGDKVTAAEAYRLGLLTELRDTDDDVLPAATALATRLAAGPTIAYAQLKRELATGAGGTLADALAVEADAQAICGATGDHLEATEAFVAKRRPDFHGR